MSFSLSEYTKVDVGWGSYSAPPDPLAGFKGAASWQEGNGGEGREGLGEEGKEEGEGKGKGRSWGIAPWLLGG